MRNSFLVGVAVLVAVLAWVWWPVKTELSKSEYDIAMALYRVCNQSNEKGLERIELLIAEDQQSNPETTASPLQPIVTQARSGQWKKAAEACRRILDEQVKDIATP